VWWRRWAAAPTLGNAALDIFISVFEASVNTEMGVFVQCKSYQEFGNILEFSY
jgi:hypothetical protein